MPGRTFVIGDIHGELGHLYAVLSSLPNLERGDKLVFVGDYMDRGPQSRQVIEYLRRFLPNETPATVITLRGNHEDAWLKVIDEGWSAFVLPEGNGCLATLRSFQPAADPTAPASREELASMMAGSFLPPDVLAWMRSLPYFYEDEHAIYVHAGVPRVQGRFPHPGEFDDKTCLLWVRNRDFFCNYRGKRIVVGHTVTETLPQDFSSYTPEDPTDLWAGEAVIAIDTGCGQGGFLTAVELPGLRVYESPRPPRSLSPGGARPLRFADESAILSP